jgi:predicted MFS family arabinose efflux permease
MGIACRSIDCGRGERLGLRRISLVTTNTGISEPSAVLLWFRQLGLLFGGPAVIGVVHFVSHAGIAASPFIIGSLIDQRGYSPATAGMVSMAELGCFAAATALISARIGGMSVRRLALGAALVAALAGFGSAAVDGLASLVVLRGLAGAAGGLLYACVCAGAARTAKPNRTYAFGYAFTTVLYSTFYPIVAAVIHVSGTRGAFGYVAAMLLLVTLILRWLPETQGTSAAPPPIDSTQRLRRDKMVLIATMATFCCGSVALWGYTERLGVAAGIPEQQVAWIQGSTNLLAIVGTLLPAWLIPLAGFRKTAVAAIVVTAVGCLGLGLAVGDVSYFFAMLLYFGGFNAGYVTFMTYAASLDRSGSASTAVGASLLVIWAAGTGVGGLAATRFGYQVIPVAGMLISFAALMPLMLLPRLRAVPA